MNNERRYLKYAPWIRRLLSFAMHLQQLESSRCKPSERLVDEFFLYFPARKELQRDSD